MATIKKKRALSTDDLITSNNARSTAGLVTGKTKAKREALQAAAYRKALIDMIYTQITTGQVMGPAPQPSPLDPAMAPAPVPAGAMPPGDPMAAMQGGMPPGMMPGGLG